MNNEMTIRQAAKQSGISARTLSHAAKTGNLRARRVRGIVEYYLVDRAALEDYAANRPKPGRKPEGRRCSEIAKAV